MNFAYDIAYLFAGAFLSNAVPHFISGVLGQPFQTPFAKPPGKGLSSSTVNVVWAFFNFLVGYLLLAHVGSFDWRTPAQIIAAAFGGFLMSLMHARWFGRLHGGDLSAESRTSP